MQTPGRRLPDGAKWHGSDPDSASTPNGLGGPPSNHTVVDRAVGLRETGLSIREIANVMDIPASTIGDWVKGIVPLEYVELDDTTPTDEDIRLGRLFKRCGRCNARLPWSAYWAAAKYEDGTMRCPQSYCRECVKDRRRELRRQDPEAARERDRRDWQRIQANPERAARRREVQRENSHIFRLRRREEAA